jgi:hypothetical protein
MSGRGGDRRRTFAWWPLISTLDIAHAAEAPFKLPDFRYPSLSEVPQYAFRREDDAPPGVQAINPPADS